MKSRLIIAAIALCMTSCSVTAERATPREQRIADPAAAFAEYEVCLSEWEKLTTAWLGGPVSSARSLEEAYELVSADRRTDLSQAFRAAWSKGESWQGRDAFPTRAQDAFIAELVPDLSMDCRSFEWMAIVISNRTPTQWPMSVTFDDSFYQPQPGDVAQSRRFIRALIAYPSR